MKPPTLTSVLRKSPTWRSLGLVLVLIAVVPANAYAVSAKREGSPGLERATPSNDIEEVGPNTAEGGFPSAVGNDSPATENSSAFDVGAGALSGADGSVSALDPPKNPAPRAAPATNVPPALGAAKARPAPSIAKSLPAPSASEVAPDATTSPDAASAVVPPFPPTGANTVPASGETVATGNEDLIAKPAADRAVVAAPLPPPNEFAGAPPVPGTMRLMADGEAPEEYLVEPGDTLFDICDQLLDEAGYWPKLWALNPEIKNPHFIFPNMRLRFYPGDDETPPYLQVVSEDDVIPIDKADLDEQQLVAEKVVFPKDQAIIADIVQVVAKNDIPELQNEVVIAGHKYDATDIEVHVPGFIFSEERDPVGHVLIGRMGEEFAWPGTEIQIQSEKGIAVGTLYTLLRQGERIENPDTGDFVGYKYYYVANARIKKAVGDGVYRSVIEDGRLAVSPGDLVVNYISTRRSVPINEETGTMRPTDANIVGWEYADEETGSRGDYAFIDKGTSEGISPGMNLPVYSTPGYLSLNTGDAGLPTDYKLIGSIRIIDVTDAGAVGYVVYATSEMRIGDRTKDGGSNNN